MIKNVLITIVIFMFLFDFARLIAAQSDCIDFAPNLLYGVGPSTSQFWSARTDDLAQCARACVRRRPCESITFDTGSNMCELNELRINETKLRRGAKLLYSEFRKWDASIDKDCFSRPCPESQVCVPGHLADIITNDCSYSCMKVASQHVCPMPAALNSSRTVSSVNTVTCGPGHVGGGSATCKANLKWSSEVKQCKQPTVKANVTA